MSLSGKPPYTVETGDKDLMLDKIMRTELNLAPLRRRAISREGIAFVRMLLNPDSEKRPTEQACFAHPWLNDGSVPAPMDVDDVLTAPQNAGHISAEAARLILNEDEVGEDGIDEVDLDEQLYDGARLSKRMRTVMAIDPREQIEVPSSPAVSYPSLPYANAEDHVAPTRLPPKSNRLFGEVGESALGSSGVIPPNQLNLKGTIEGSSDPLSEASTFERALESSHLTQTARIDYSSNQASLSEEYSMQEDTEPQPSAAASLMGAESLVGHLNVTSPTPRISPVSTPKSPLTPATPRTQGSSPGSSMVKHPREEEKVDPDAAGPSKTQPKKFSRRVSLPIPDSYYYDAWDKSTHNAEYAAKMRALDENARKGQLTGGSKTELDGKGKEVNTKGPGQELVHSGREEAELDDREHANSLRETKAEIDPTGLAPKSDVQKDNEVVDESDTGLTAAAAVSLTKMEPDNQLKQFARPLPILGKLISTPNSVLNIFLHLNKRDTSWGRSSANSIVYPNGQDIRIPKYAFDILFWKPGLPDQIRQGINWTEVADVPAVIKTRASRHIYVNGVPLVHRDREGNPFGKLYTGDVITVWEDKETGKEIKLVCEFYHGASVNRRPEALKGFQVEHVEFVAGAGSRSASGSGSQSELSSTTSK